MREEDVKAQFFRGSAQIQLKNLCYPDSEVHLDECIGCCTSDYEHNLPVTIQPSDYYNAIQQSHTSVAAMYEVGRPQKLLLPSSLILPCLHGRFRLENAQKDSTRLNEWWNVDIYFSDMGHTIHNQIRSLYRKHLPPSDGEKYLHIRYHQRQKNRREEELWTKKLSDPKQKNLSQILRNKWLVLALDDLEPFRALWSDFQFGSFSPILSWRCHKVIMQYLDRMRTGWSTYTEENSFWCDGSSVKRLGGLAPRWSSRDRCEIEKFYRTNQIFSRVQDMPTRSRIIHRVLSEDGLILTFATFFKHILFLRPAMFNVRELFPALKARKDIVEVCRRWYVGPKEDPNRILVQYGENDERLEEAPEEDHVYCAYWQLCLYLIRVRHILPQTKKEWKKSPEPPEWLIRLGALAYRLGFETEKILELNQLSPELSAIRKNMRSERPADLYSVSVENFDLEATSRRQRQDIFKPRNTSSTPLMATAMENCVSKTTDCTGMFLPYIQKALQQKSSYALTPFGRSVLIFIAFFEGLHSTIKLSAVAGWDHSRHDIVQKEPDIQPSESTSRNPPLHNDQVSTQPLQQTASSIYSPAIPMEISPQQSLTGQTDARTSPRVQRNESYQAMFWHLESGTYKLATSIQDIDTVKKIISIRAKPKYLLLDIKKQLKLCTEDQLDRYLSRRGIGLKTVYYVYQQEGSTQWIGKKAPPLPAKYIRARR